MMSRACRGTAWAPGGSSEGAAVGPGLRRQGSPDADEAHEKLWEEEVQWVSEPLAGYRDILSIVRSA